MNTDEHEFKHREVSKKTIGVFYEVYNELGHGFIESVHHKSMVIALKTAGLEVCSPVVIPVSDFDGDVLVEQSILLELKAVRALDSAHQAQLLNYLRATNIEVGPLLNFGVNQSLRGWSSIISARPSV